MAEQNLKPCTSCRRRKVKCDKNIPCANCMRSHVQCTYEEQSDYDGLAPLALDKPTTMHLFDRISGLERLLSKMADNSIHAPSQGAYPSVRNHTKFARATASEGDDVESGFPFPFSEMKTRSSMFASEFPSTHDSDLLIQFFLELTEPFIRMLHVPFFHKQLADYRSGNSPLYFEAMVPCIHALAVATLSSNFVMDFFRLSRDELITTLRAAAESALLKADFMRSPQPIVLRATLYYITFLFEIGDNEYGSTLLGAALRIAIRIGIHHNPKDVSPFVCDMRQRLWLHLQYLDGRARDLLGTESSMKLDWNTEPPKHTNDQAWEDFRTTDEIFVGEPEAVNGFADTSYVLARHEIEALQKQIRVTGMPFEQAEAYINERKQHIWLQHLSSGSNLILQRFIEAVLEVRIASVYLTARHAHHRGASDSFRGQTFLQAIDLLERISSIEGDVDFLQYVWVLRSFLPMTAIVTTLTCTLLRANPDCEARSEKQIDAVYARYNNADCQLARTSVFEPIHELKKQGDLVRKQRQLDRMS